MKRSDRRAWHQGPVFEYRASTKMMAVDVTGSSWPIHGLQLAQAIVKELRKFEKLAGRRILDFGAGSWLRYSQHILNRMPDRDLFAVEYDQAFHNGAAELREQFESDLTIWRPIDFVKQKKIRFDLALVVNVLNTIPEVAHRSSIFSTLVKRLNPNGRLLVYQRIWAQSENPEGAISYGDGWFIPQPHQDYHTYRAGTGKRWFNEQASAAGLRPVPTVELSSANTLLRVWENPF